MERSKLLGKLAQGIKGIKGDHSNASNIWGGQFSDVVAGDILKGLTERIEGVGDLLHNFPRQSDKAFKADEFADLADSWWDPQGPMAPLHKINPLRVLYLDTHVNLAGKKLLDVGCGGGIFSESLAARGAQVIAIDPSQQLIDIAQKHQQSQQQQDITSAEPATSTIPVGESSDSNNKTLNEPAQIDYLCCDTRQLVQDKKRLDSFDIVSCMEVLEHVDDPSKLVKECISLLKPGGVAYFSTINRTLTSFLQAIALAEYVLRWLPQGTHSHSKFIPPAELADWLTAAAAPPFSIKGMTYDLSSMSFQLSRDTDVNYLLLARKDKSSHKSNL